MNPCVISGPSLPSQQRAITKSDISGQRGGVVAKLARKCSNYVQDPAENQAQTSNFFVVAERTRTGPQKTGPGSPLSPEFCRTFGVVQEVQWKGPA